MIRHRSRILLVVAQASVVAALLGCRGSDPACDGCASPTGVDLAGLWDVADPRPTDLRVCVDGMCRLEPVGPDDLTAGPGAQQVRMVVAPPGTVVRTLRIDVLAGEQILASARGRELGFPADPHASGCACSRRETMVVLDPASGQLVVRTTPR
jgi:hypothetical protein